MLLYKVVDLSTSGALQKMSIGIEWLEHENKMMEIKSSLITPAASSIPSRVCDVSISRRTSSLSKGNCGTVAANAGCSDSESPSFGLELSGLLVAAVTI